MSLADARPERKGDRDQDEERDDEDGTGDACYPGGAQ